MDKIQNTKDLSFYNNAILLSETINKQCADSKIDTKEAAALDLMQTLIIDILFYVNNLQTHIANCKVQNSKLRELRNEGLLKINDLQEQIESFDENLLQFGIYYIYLKYINTKTKQNEKNEQFR